MGADVLVFWFSGGGFGGGEPVPDESVGDLGFEEEAFALDMDSISGGVVAGGVLLVPTFVVGLPGAGAAFDVWVGSPGVGLVGPFLGIFVLVFFGPGGGV